MTISLQTQSRMWQEEANKLLDNSQLYPILSKLGEVKFTGSYAYDLMLDADIDIYVIVPNSTAKSSALKALNALIEQNYWNGYLFYDFVSHGSKYHPSFPKSYYVGLKADYADHRWKVDVWFGEDETLSHNNDWIGQSLNDESKNTILEIKKARNNGEFRVDSHKIYEAVLKQNIKSVSEFRNRLLLGA